MKSIGGNSGYVGYSMSKRASKARNDGKYPKSDFKRKYFVTASHFDYLKLADIIYISEWHHTSRYGNRTNFYRWSEDSYINIYQENKKVISALIKLVGKEPKMEDYAIEDMQKYCEAYNAFIERRRNIVEQIQDVFYNED